MMPHIMIIFFYRYRFRAWLCTGRVFVLCSCWIGWMEHEVQKKKKTKFTAMPLRGACANKGQVLRFSWY